MNRPYARLAPKVNGPVVWDERSKGGIGGRRAGYLSTTTVTVSPGQPRDSLT